MSNLSNDTKKHTTKSRETIPLKIKLLYNSDITSYFPKAYDYKQASSYSFLALKKNNRESNLGRADTCLEHSENLIWPASSFSTNC
jgi:hypothetical protein